MSKCLIAGYPEILCFVHGSVQEIDTGMMFHTWISNISDKSSLCQRNLDYHLYNLYIYLLELGY